MTKAKLMLVEDELIVREDLREKLTDLGYEVCALAASGEEAVALAAARRPDLVLMDVRLAGEMDGIEAARRISRRHRLPVIFLSALADEALFARARSAEALAYLLKPIDHRELAFALESALARLDMERRLRESEELFRTVADFTYDWETLRDPDGRYVYVSPSCERVSGYRREEFLADPELLEKIVHPEDLAMILDHSRSLQDAEGVHNLDFRIIDRSGLVRWISHSCQPVLDQEGVFRGRRASNREITERKWAEEELRRAKEELESRVAVRTAELVEANQRLRQLSRELLHAQEEERKRVALDLHDETGQLLSALRIGLHALAGANPDQGAGFERLLDISQRILDRVRTLAQTLRPAILDRFGLALAVEDLVEGVAETARVEVQVTELKVDEARLSAEAKTTLFRFLQEGLTNAVRHSGSSRVEVGLKPQGRVMTATVRDFGRGFEVDQTLAQAFGQGRLGLMGMMDRLALLGGRLSIRSGPGGTTLCAEIPWETEA